MTYLQLINAVLVRLRESEVSTSSENAYSTLIGKFINDAKRMVEDAWTWTALDTTLTVTTTPGVSLYTVTGSGRRQKDVSVNDATNQARLTNVPASFIQDQQQLSTVQNAAPSYYAWTGFDGTDSKIEFFPTPNGAFTIYINTNVPQAELTSDNTSILVPTEPVILYAYARAIAERGEDGGLSTSEAYGLAKSSLADAIALEAARQHENDCWVAV